MHALQNGISVRVSTTCSLEVLVYNGPVCTLVEFRWSYSAQQREYEPNRQYSTLRSILRPASKLIENMLPDI